ncbi:MAG: hypothetical protein J6Y98_05275 [Bacteroidales bacterium]|nr:hypothetical protein [Bacteroidales bacterium]
MIPLKEKISTEPGFQYVIDNMELMSTSGRQLMLHQNLFTDAEALLSEYDNIERMVAVIGDEERKPALDTLRHQFMQLHDLTGTLANISRHSVLDEIELYEIKNLSHICTIAAKSAAELGIADILRLPDTKSVFSLLDPDSTNIPHFYIYDSYHPQLPDIRRQLKALQIHLDTIADDNDEKKEMQLKINDLLDKQNDIQRLVLEQLSEKLHSHLQLLTLAHNQMAYGDFLLAKATMAKRWQLSRPSLSSDGSTRYLSLWNPRLRHRNEELHQRYQPVDIEIHKGTCLVTGANMAGKTVLLKSVGIAQLMAQYGFYVPAEKAQISIVGDVAFCIGDEQNEMNGLSSFASEITKISSVLTRAKKERLLILIDEPARTTNPVEGKALVQAVATLLDKESSQTIITTHYSQLGLSCRRLRVKGFVESLSDAIVTPANINSFIDYSLLPDNSDEVPHEALRIASIMQCDKEMLETAEHFLQKE